MTFADEITVVVPTYDRPHLLRRLLRYLSDAADPPCIMVLDSSNPAARSANAATIAMLRHKVDYRLFDPSITPFDKFLEGVGGVATPNVAFCPDDDVLLLPGLRRLVRELDDTGTVAVHGRYLGFESGRRYQIVTRFEQDSRAIEAPTPLGRVVTLLSNYQALTYAACRTADLAESFAGARGVKSILLREITSGAILAARGRVRRCAMVTHLRAIDGSSRYRHWHPLEYATRNAQHFCQEVAAVIDVILPVVAPGERERARGVLQLAFLGYLATNVSDPALAAAIGSALAGEPVERNILRGFCAHYATGSLILDRIRGSALGERLRALKIGTLRRAAGRPLVRTTPAGIRLAHHAYRPSMLSMDFADEATMMEIDRAFAG